MERAEIVGAIEAMLFAAGDPLSKKDLKIIFERLWTEVPEEQKQDHFAELDDAIAELEEHWKNETGRGFCLVAVAEGFAFRTNPRFADALKAMREQRPVRLSRAALETMAIVAYRQPATKPEIDHIRGVDCGGTIRLLLDRGLIRIVGKKEEPGLPLLYGTTREFLSFFNISDLSQLPSLREYHELNEDSQEILESFDNQMGISELQKEAPQLGNDEEPAVKDLEAAMSSLRSTERGAREALQEEGISLEMVDAEEVDNRPVNRAEQAGNVDEGETASGIDADADESTDTVDVPDSTETT